MTNGKLTYGKVGDAELFLMINGKLTYEKVKSSRLSYSFVFNFRFQPEGQDKKQIFQYQ